MLNLLKKADADILDFEILVYDALIYNENLNYLYQHLKLLSFQNSHGVNIGPNYDPELTTDI